MLLLRCRNRQIGAKWRVRSTGNLIGSVDYSGDVVNELLAAITQGRLHVTVVIGATILSVCV
jgi:hypothetical protein